MNRNPAHHQASPSGVSLTNIAGDHAVAVLTAALAPVCNGKVRYEVTRPMRHGGQNVLDVQLIRMDKTFPAVRIIVRSTNVEMSKKNSHAVSINLTRGSKFVPVKGRRRPEVSIADHPHLADWVAIVHTRYRLVCLMPMSEIRTGPNGTGPGRKSVTIRSRLFWSKYKKKRPSRYFEDSGTTALYDHLVSEEDRRRQSRGEEKLRPLPIVFYDPGLPPSRM